MNYDYNTIIRGNAENRTALDEKMSPKRKNSGMQPVATPVYLFYEAKIQNIPPARFLKLNPKKSLYAKVPEVTNSLKKPFTKRTSCIMSLPCNEPLRKTENSLSTGFVIHEARLERVFKKRKVRYFWNFRVFLSKTD